MHIFTYMKKKFKKMEIKDILTNWQEASGCYEDIIPFLNAPHGTAYFRNETGAFQEEVFEPINE